MDYITGEGRVDDVLIAVRRLSTQAVYETQLVCSWTKSEGYE